MNLSVVSTFCDPMDCGLCPWDSPGKNTRVGYHSLLQGVFATQGLNLSLLHCRQILYPLNHQGSPVPYHDLISNMQSPEWYLRQASDSKADVQIHKNLEKKVSINSGPVGLFVREQ